jgi:hypothetical protein
VKREPVAPTASALPKTPPALSVAAASASVVLDAAAAGPCPPNAKNYDEPRFCITFAEKPLDVTYEGGPEEGNVELEAKGGNGVIRLSWVPLARAGNDPLKAQVERIEDDWELVSSGDLGGGGAWAEIKQTGADEKTRHVVHSLVKTKKLLVDCNYSTTAENAAKARDVCKSIRGY